MHASINTQFLMTLHAPLDPPQKVSSELWIYNVRPGGWVKGPHVSGTIVAPSADWLRFLPNGTQRLDIRTSILADDGSYIFISYVGRIVTVEQFHKKSPPKALCRTDPAYFFTAPVFETDSPKYSWLNDVVCVGKNVATGNENDDFVRYDIFAAS